MIEVLELCAQNFILMGTLIFFLQRMGGASSFEKRLREILGDQKLVQRDIASQLARLAMALEAKGA